jgi:hypothetical protein
MGLIEEARKELVEEDNNAKFRAAVDAKKSVLRNKKPVDSDEITMIVLAIITVVGIVAFAITY